MKQLKFKYLLFIFLFSFSKSILTAQVQLLSIDSLYLTTIEHFYNNAESVKSEIWEGMKFAPVCMFRINGPALLYNHPQPPKSFVRVTDKLYVGTQQELQLFGATQAEINGILTAIVDYGYIHYSSIEELYAELFHELHHVYQRNFVKEIEYDNPATLLTYPEDYRNDGIKLFEQKTLYKMCFEEDSILFQELLNQFYSCRLEREQIIGNYIEYEKTVENIEGPPFYCEYKFYNHFANFDQPMKESYNQKNFFGVLTTPYYGRKNLRYRHLASGFAMCYILNKQLGNWQSDYYSQSLSLYDYFISKFIPQKETLKINSMYYDLSEFHTHQTVIEHEVLYDKFNTQEGLKVTLNFKEYPQFEGFDPMNAESINDSTVLHKTFLKLSGGENNKLFITNKNVATIIEDQIWFVKEVILFQEEENMLIEDNRITIKTGNENISWSGNLEAKTGDEIFFNCE